MTEQSDFCGALTERIQDWFEHCGAVGVRLDIVDDPKEWRKQFDYYVVREFGFIPASNDKVRLEFFVTSDDEVGVTLEYWDRIYERLAVDRKITSQWLFGFDPLPFVFGQLVPILETARDGRMSVEMGRFCGRYVPVRIRLLSYSGPRMESMDYGTLPPVVNRVLLKILGIPSISLTYRPWSDPD